MAARSWWVTRVGDRRWALFVGRGVVGLGEYYVDSSPVSWLFVVGGVVGWVDIIHGGPVRALLLILRGHLGLSLLSFLLLVLTPGLITLRLLRGRLDLDFSLVDGFEESPEEDLTVLRVV